MSNIKINRGELPYRQAVIGIVLDDDKRFLVAQAITYGEDDWRFPGGGVDGNEKLEETLLRELEEELGTNNFEIIKKANFINQYEWPDHVVEDQFKKKGIKYRGQEQVSFLVKFKGKKEDVKIQTEELRKVKWVKYDELKNHFTFPNQWNDAEKALKELL